MKDLFNLDILTRSYETKRGLFLDEPRNFETRSDEEDDTCSGIPSPTIHTTLEARRLTTIYDLTCNRPTYLADLHWKWVSDLATPRPTTGPPWSSFMKECD
ncbi:hypothetical protein AVEN_2501-1 [Araneus ventricosus]|uniref:Uncharacterized protein n=1 Tax=Araneus ventricosus TaxID=182803 RepID=A0A4Y2GBZ8_ARAVE|nr:hypothetical protein AVEN_2501-1 [Araneus ventricosus]